MRDRLLLRTDKKGVVQWWMGQHPSPKCSRCDAKTSETNGHFWVVEYPTHKASDLRRRPPLAVCRGSTRNTRNLGMKARYLSVHCCCLVCSPCLGPCLCLCWETKGSWVRDQERWVTKAQVGATWPREPNCRFERDEGVHLHPKWPRFYLVH
jgi:hypothetical protein